MFHLLCSISCSTAVRVIFLFHCGSILVRTQPVTRSSRRNPAQRPYERLPLSSRLILRPLRQRSGCVTPCCTWQLDASVVVLQPDFSQVKQSEKNTPDKISIRRRCGIPLHRWEVCLQLARQSCLSEESAAESKSPRQTQTVVRRPRTHLLHRRNQSFPPSVLCFLSDWVKRCVDKCCNAQSQRLTTIISQHI